MSSSRIKNNLLKGESATQKAFCGSKQRNFNAVDKRSSGVCERKI
jgi:hypothetical protein